MKTYYATREIAEAFTSELSSLYDFNGDWDIAIADKKTRGVEEGAIVCKLKTRPKGQLAAFASGLEVIAIIEPASIPDCYPATLELMIDGHNGQKEGKTRSLGVVARKNEEYLGFGPSKAMQWHSMMAKLADKEA